MRKTARTIALRWTTPLWKLTIAGILIGAVIGGLALRASSANEASALLRLYPPVDPNQIMTTTALTPDPQQSYIAGELTYLESPGFADAVARELNEAAPPQLSATQESQSSIVSLAATGPNYEDAERIVTAAVKVYSNHVQQQTRQRGQTAIDAINRVIAQETRAAGANPNSTPPIEPAPPANGQQSTLQQLLAQRAAIEVQTERPAPVQVVQPPTKTPAGGAPRWSLGVVGGGLAGGLLALAGALTWRRRVGVITSPSALEGQIDRVLVPTVRLGASSATNAELARSLYAQLPAPRTGRILVVGASAGSGSADVARLIRSAVAEHQTDETTAVIDGECVDTSSALPEAAGSASQIIIVAKIGRDVNDGVRIASQLAAQRDLPVLAVCTRGRSRSTSNGTGNRRHGKRTVGDPDLGTPDGSSGPAVAVRRTVTNR